MTPDDLTVEVRDKSLQRLGVILPEHLTLEASLAWNGVGEWTLKISRDHHLAPAISAPGSGIVVTDTRTNRVIYSGPMTIAKEEQASDAVGGYLTMTGVSDEVFLADARAYPDPNSPTAETQNAPVDERSGIAETLMHEFVAVNIGPNAPQGRRDDRITMGLDQKRGEGVTISANLEPLGELISGIALPHGLGFQLIQEGNYLKFRTYQGLDRTAQIRLSVDNNGLSRAERSTTVPTLTRAIVAGYSSAVARLYVERSTAKSLSAEQEWGRRIEGFVDQRGSRNLDELEQAASEALAEGGFTGQAFVAEPTETMKKTFGTDWFLGDTISAVLNGSVYAVQVIGAVLKMDKDGVRLGITLGDSQAVIQVQGGFNVPSIDRRVANLERAMPTPNVLPTTALHLNPGFDDIDASTGLPAGWEFFWNESSDITLDRFDKVAGAQSLRVVHDSNEGDLNIGTSEMAVTPGATLEFTFWSKSDFPQELQVTLLTNDTNNAPDYFAGGSLLLQTQESLIGTDWRKLTHRWVIPVSHSRARIYIRANASGMQTVWLDETATSLTAQSASGGGSPTGTVEMFAGASAPTGYLLCDGAIYNMGDYPALALVCGSTYGGNGSTTFAVPDMRARFPIGMGGSYGGGALGHSDSQAVNDRTTWHSHTIPNQGSYSDIRGVPSGTASFNTATRSALESHDHSGSTGGNNSAATFPHLALNFIIKT